jgi:iron(III) transport system ATP-binding protein
MSAAVELRSLSKRYDRVEALAGVSLHLAARRFLVLLGPSGSGKSTLIRCLAGIERPTAGEIAIGGETVADGRRHVAPERRDLAMVFQDHALWPHMTVADNVAFALRRRRLRPAEAEQRVGAMLARVGLARYGGRYPHELSGGEQQRVALARALVAHPKLLLFDEPLSSLDANLRDRLRVEIGTLVREHGTTAVYITHDQREAFALGDEIGVLQGGRLVQRGTPEEVYRAPLTPFVARFTGLAGVLHGPVLGAAGTADAAGRHPVRVVVPTTAPDRFLELHGTAPALLPEGSAVQIMLRPTAVRICSPDTPKASLRGVVRDGAYHGRGYDYVLELGSGIELGGVYHRRRFARGETVGMVIQSSGALVFPADAALPAPLLAAEAVPAPAGSTGRSCGTQPSETAPDLPAWVR